MFTNLLVVISLFVSSPSQSFTHQSTIHHSKSISIPVSSFNPFSSPLSLSPPSLPLPSFSLPTSIFLSSLLTQPVNAISSPLSTGDFNPDNFRPVCSSSDGFYRFLQGSTEAVVGSDNFVEYGPLIAGGLLRIRLELCVVESFFNEAIVPFVRENGLSWILPFHETIETFLAGTIFALATTFILVGSTKLITVIVTFADVFVGNFFRLIGGFGFDRATGKPITLDIGVGPFKKRVVGPPEDKSKQNEKNEKKNIVTIEDLNAGNAIPLLAFGSLKTVGEASRIIREITESLDLFVGRYLVLLSTAYVGLKFVHFKVFPDFPF